MMIKDIQEKILKLKKEKNICILAHCYQTHDILEIADFTGDSFGLAQKAAETVKHGRGDFEGSDAGSSMESENCTAQVILHDSGMEGLGAANIEVRDRSGNLLYTLPVSWQVPAGGEAP